MKRKPNSFCDRVAISMKGGLTVFFIGIGPSVLPGQDLLINGDFGSGLAGWKTEGSVAAGVGVATLNEGTTAPVLYQAVSVSGYVYELRFDVDLGGLSATAGAGELDKARLLLYLARTCAKPLFKFFAPLRRHWNPIGDYVHRRFSPLSVRKT